MTGRFAQALLKNPAPEKLGDVTIRYDTSLLIGETEKVKPGWLPVVGLLIGVGGLTGVGVIAIIDGGYGAMAASSIACAFGFWAATVLNQREKRQRRFVLNFADYGLRLDFSTPIARRPRSMVVDFDRVRSIDRREQADGRWCLTVDFALKRDDDQVLREVLVADVAPFQEEQLDALERILVDALDPKPEDEREPPPGEAEPDAEPEQVTDVFVSDPPKSGGV